MWALTRVRRAAFGRTGPAPRVPLAGEVAGSERRFVPPGASGGRGTGSEAASEGGVAVGDAPPG